MRALIEATHDAEYPAEIVRVISPSEGSGAAVVASELGVEVRIVPYGDDFGLRLCDALLGCDYLCLAGFMRILPNEVLKLLPDRVLNIHPALLPKFGGRGMYGHHVHEAVVAAGETESGCTVHLVNEKYDEGPILLQLKVSVDSCDTADEVAAKVLELEHKAYPIALKRLIDGGRSQAQNTELHS